MPACGFCSHSCPVRCTFSFFPSYSIHILYTQPSCSFNWMLLFKGIFHGVYWILLKTLTTFSRVSRNTVSCFQKHLYRSPYSKIQCPTEANTSLCILPTQLHQLPALTTVEGSSSSLAAVGLARALARPWYPPQTAKPPASADTRFIVLKPGVAGAESQGRGTRALPAHGCGVCDCRLQRQKRGLLHTWPSCRGTCSAVAGSSKWCGLVPRPDPPRTWLRTSHHPPSYSPRWNRQVLQGERGGQAVSAGPRPAEPARQLPAGKGRGWAAAASAPYPLFTAAAAVNK